MLQSQKTSTVLAECGYNPQRSHTARPSRQRLEKGQRMPQHKMVAELCIVVFDNREWRYRYWLRINSDFKVTEPHYWLYRNIIGGSGCPHLGKLRVSGPQNGQVERGQPLPVAIVGWPSWGQQDIWGMFIPKKLQQTGILLTQVWYYPTISTYIMFQFQFLKWTFFTRTIWKKSIGLLGIYRDE